MTLEWKELTQPVATDTVRTVAAFLKRVGMGTHVSDVSEFAQLINTMSIFTGSVSGDMCILGCVEFGYALTGKQARITHILSTDSCPPDAQHELISRLLAEAARWCGSDGKKHLPHTSVILGESAARIARQYPDILARYSTLCTVEIIKAYTNLHNVAA